MHILYIDQHFRTPEEGGAIRSYYLAKGLVDAGQRVTMLSGYAGRTYKRGFVDGIHVHYLPLRAPVGSRRAMLRFGWLVCRKAAQFRKADLCYATAAPLTVGLIGSYFSVRFGIPFYVEVPVTEPASSFSKKVSKTTRWLRSRLEKRLYHEANALVALTPEGERHLRSVAPHQSVRLIPHVADCQFFRRTERNEYHERQFGVSGKFVITYFGPLEPDYRLENLLNAARACQQQLDDVHFLLVGGGSDQAHLQAYAERARLNNLRFLPGQNKYGLLSVLNITDAAYIPLADGPGWDNDGSAVFFDALAAGKLCIVSGPGWIADLVEENGCGFSTPPQHGEALATQLAPFVNDRQLLDVYQRNARTLGEQRFERKQQVKALLDSLSPPLQRAKADTLPA
jgi:glycosyltransferase involved in cell wall biosynthesis